MSHSTAEFLSHPVCMGGVGGSGTRLGAEIMEALGIYIGPVLNKASDNFSFPPLKKLLEGVTAEEDREVIIYEGLQGFERVMHDNFLQQETGRFHQWGWKIPGSFHWLPYTSKYFGELRYVHFIRHGLDMSFSGNRNQVKNWGAKFGIAVESPPTPQNLLDYWVAANNHAIETGQALLGDRFLLLNFDQLCLSPETEFDRLADFLAPDATGDQRQRARALIRPPRSIGRHRERSDNNTFSEQSIAAVRALGFEVD